jgi:hypothetical protein
MKKKIYLLVLLGSLFFLGACTNEEIAEFEVLHQEEGLVSFEAGFQPMSGRTILEEGGKVKWSVGDEIVLFDSSVSARYVAIASGSSTLFVLKDGEKALDSNGSYTAFYPADRFDVTKRSFSVKQVQQAVSGSFDPDAALCMATVTNRDYVTFRNLCTLMKVNVPQAAIDGGVAAMNLSAPAFIVSGATLASDGTLNWNQTIKNFRMEGSFEYGKDYYLVIPPQTFEQGFTLAMNDANNATLQNCARTKTSAVTFEASKSYTMGTIFEVVADNSWYEEVVETTPDAVEFEVSTPEQFVSFVQMMNGLETRSAGASFEGKTIKLENDLDFTYFNDAINPIKNFKGSFDGQGFTIKNLKINSDAQFVGLFASLQAGQTIQNLTLQGGKIVSNYKDTHIDNGFVGSILGYAYGGSVINCHNAGCEVMGQGPNYVSGIVGGVKYNCGFNVIACSNSANVTSDVNTTVYVGGITTRWGGNIRMVACYNEGTINMKQADMYSYAGGLSGDFGGYNYMYGCFNSGSVIGVDYRGSLVGTSSYSAYVYNCCYDDEQLSDVGYPIGSPNKYNVSKCSYAEAVDILNVGIEYYNKKENVPCEYRFVAGDKPALVKVNPNQESTGTPGLGEGEIL